MIKIVLIKINFTNAVGGQVQVNILGPGTNMNYTVTNDDARPQPLDAATYTIQVIGTSGGTLELDITESGNILLSRSCPPTHLFIVGSFTV